MKVPIACSATEVDYKYVSSGATSYGEVSWRVKTFEIFVDFSHYQEQSHVCPFCHSSIIVLASPKHRRTIEEMKEQNRELWMDIFQFEGSILVVILITTIMKVWLIMWISLAVFSIFILASLLRFIKSNFRVSPNKLVLISENEKMPKHYLHTGIAHRFISWTWDNLPDENSFTWRH